LRVTSVIQYIEKYTGCELAADFSILGSGKEGVVFNNQQTVYKLFYKEKNYSILLLAMLKQVSNRLQCSKGIKPVPNFIVNFDDVLIVSYVGVQMLPYERACKIKWVSFMKSLMKYDLCVTNIKPDNLRLLSSGELIYIDIGRDILIYEEDLFRDSCVQGFSVFSCESCGLEVKVFHSIEKLANYLSINVEKTSRDFEKFYRDILNG